MGAIWEGSGGGSRPDERHFSEKADLYVAVKAALPPTGGPDPRAVTIQEYSDDLATRAHPRHAGRVMADVLERTAWFG